MQEKAAPASTPYVPFEGWLRMRRTANRAETTARDARYDSSSGASSSMENADERYLSATSPTAGIHACAPTRPTTHHTGIHAVARRAPPSLPEPTADPLATRAVPARFAFPMISPFEPLQEATTRIHPSPV